MVVTTTDIKHDEKIMRQSGLVYPWSKNQDPQPLLSREWLVTNGLGGYASGSLMGISTRRYHGLFIPNLPAPRGRTVMVPRVDEEIVMDGDVVLMNGCEEPGGSITGRKQLYLTEFRVEWEMPVWTFEMHGRVIEKRIIMPHYHNIVYLEYRLVEGEPVTMRIRPYVTFRGHDEPLGTPKDWPFKLIITRGCHEIHPAEGIHPLRMAIRPKAGVFVADDIYSDVFYRIEKIRGLDHTETLFSPGYFTFELTGARPVSFVVSTEFWEHLEHESPRIIEGENHRLERLLRKAHPSLQEGLAAQLVLAADQFICMPGTRLEENILYEVSGEHMRTMMAGYHWFTDWGRDTMISLEGLCLCTGRQDEAKAILRTFANYVRNGLLPNHFPEGERNAIYNTCDATFWYFHAIDRYLEFSGDRETLQDLFPLLNSIIEHHLRCTLFGIGVDPEDTLVRASAEGYQLTWMDAKVADWVVTPRRGKPVEIQGLWYNALCLMAEWSELLGESSKGYFQHLAKKARVSFNRRFWYSEGQYLYDVIDAEDEEREDTRLRPNQLFAFSLKYPILDEDKWEPILNIVTEKLLTPYGLRTLDPRHKDYRPHYEGDRWARDAAYHQGLVWTWLIGHYINAWMRVHKKPVEARKLLHAFEDHIKDAGVGTVSEIFDAEEPHRPRGCIAQAWSVAELIRVIYMLNTYIPEPGRKEDPFKDV